MLVRAVDVRFEGCHKLDRVGWDSGGDPEG